MPIRTLILIDTHVENISFLENCHTLKKLEIWRTPISDLTPIDNLAELDELRLVDTQVTDLSPLEKLKLKKLYIYSNNIKDISYLNISCLKSLSIQDTFVTELSVLKTNNLFYFEFSVNNIPDDETGLDVVRAMTNCYINMLPYDSFWEKHNEKHKK